MSSVQVPASSDEAKKDLPLQEASLDIWDTKYRLKSKSGQPIDEDVDATYKRVAYALAEVEHDDAKREYWYQRFTGAPSPPGASCPTPAPGTTSLPRPRSTAPSRAPSMIP